MWTSVALVAALSLAPSQTGQLQLTNVRSTYGFLGSDRPDNKLLPGDSLYLAFDIEGIKADPASGKVLYAMGMEVTNSKGKVEFKQDPMDQETYNTLGGSRVPAFAHVDVGLDQPPGEYNLKVTVVDRATKATEVLTRKFDVQPKSFGLVRLQLTNGKVMVPPIGVPGQECLIQFAALGFEREKAKKQPSIAVEMVVKDSTGKATLTQPFTGGVDRDVPDGMEAIPMQFLLKLNRAGKFTVELKATDQLAKKSTTLSFPVTVVDQK